MSWATKKRNNMKKDREISIRVQGRKRKIALLRRRICNDTKIDEKDREMNHNGTVSIRMGISTTL